MTPDPGLRPAAEGAGRFTVRETVVRREILLGEVWFASPTICVATRDELLALYVPPGAEFGAHIAAALDAGARWWDEAWAAWEPDPARPLARLPEEWQSVPVTHRATTA